MSDESTEVVPQSEKSSASPENQETLTKAQHDYKQDMFRYKNEAAEMREQLKGIELDKQQKSGNLEGVIGTLKNEIKELKHGRASDKLSYAETQLNSSIKEELLARGVKGKKLDAFLKLVDDDDKSIVELDDRFIVNTEDVKSLVDKNMERYGDLFKTSVKIVDGVPNNNAISTGKKVKDISSMSWDEAKAYMETLEK